MNSAIEFLIKNELIVKEISVSEQAARFSSTKLGLATLASSLSPGMFLLILLEEAIVVFGELKKAMKCFVLEDELHVIYHITPTYLSIEPNWQQYLNIFMQMNDTHRAISHIIGISEG